MTGRLQKKARCDGLKPTNILQHRLNSNSIAQIYHCEYADSVVYLHDRVNRVKAKIRNQ